MKWNLLILVLTIGRSRKGHSVRSFKSNKDPLRHRQLLILECVEWWIMNFRERDTWDWTLAQRSFEQWSPVSFGHERENVLWSCENAADVPRAHSRRCEPRSHCTEVLAVDLIVTATCGERSHFSRIIRRRLQSVDVARRKAGPWSSIIHDTMVTGPYPAWCEWCTQTQRYAATRSPIHLYRP